MVLSHADILDGRGAVVEMDGSLDSFTSPDFEAYIDKLLSKNILFILFDATNMTYASSEGIGLLLFLDPVRSRQVDRRRRRLTSNGVDRVVKRVYKYNYK